MWAVLREFAGCTALVNRACQSSCLHSSAFPLYPPPTLPTRLPTRLLVTCQVPLRTLGKHGSSVRSVSFSPDGASLVSSSYDTVLDVSEVATGERSWSVDMGSSAQQVTRCFAD